MASGGADRPEHAQAMEGHVSNAEALLREEESILAERRDNLRKLDIPGVQSTYSREELERSVRESEKGVADARRHLRELERQRDRAVAAAGASAK